MSEDSPSRNRLGRETSPYLLQHASNPVDWYPWGDEAFRVAKETDRPILVSIGYSSCHWCHVMEHESFEDPQIAAYMNEHFVNVKVDREERPDVDEIYMTAVQMMGIGGGWPLNVFVTPDGVPFFGGTYYPPERVANRPSWPDLLMRLTAAWQEQRDDVLSQGRRLSEALRNSSSFPASERVLGVEVLDRAFAEAAERFDEKNGGFNDAPKFPPHQLLELLLRRAARSGDAEALRYAERTLQAMADGGMYDQLGGGFHRYSVDERWLVPHFEKMLYDNAQLAKVYAQAFQLTGNPEWERVARETLDYVLREMTDEAGGYWSATDADSDGREGIYFVWREQELDERLMDEAPLFKRAYGVTADGNFLDVHHPTDYGMNVLHVATPRETLVAEFGGSVEEIESRLAAARATLFEARKGRTYPGLDDKVLGAWNGLMISGMAYAGRTFGEPRYLESAERAAGFVLDRLRREDGELLRTYRRGTAKIDAFLEDYAFLAQGYLDLYEATFDVRWFAAARDLVARMNARFWDDEQGGWFHTPADGEELITRTKSPFDGAIPAGNAVAAQAMVRVARFTGDSELLARAERVFRVFAAGMDRAPSGTVGLLMALEDWHGGGREIAIVGDPADPATRGLIDVVHRQLLPGAVLAQLTPGDDAAAAAIPLLAGKQLVDGAPAVYVCENFACRQPLTQSGEVLEALEISPGSGRRPPRA